MRKHYLTFGIVFIILLLSRCSKPDVPQADTPAAFKITLIKGGGQTDTIGKMLKDTLVFELTKGTDTIRNGYLRFETYDCDDKPIIQEFNLQFLRFSYPFRMQYPWKLNGIKGTQSLKVVYLDSLKVPADSIAVSATALAPLKGWYESGCFPANTFIASFCKLPSGRILAAQFQKGYPLYSDDEGITWHLFTSFPADYKIGKLVSTSLNEIFLAVDDVGMFYSSDGGEHWTKRNTGLPAQGFWADISYTNSGKLFALTLSGIFTSPDKGLNWHHVSYGLSSYAGFSCASSLADGTIYAVHDRKLIVSIDEGEGWRPVYPISGLIVTWLYIDENENMYVSGGAYATSGSALWVSTDHSQTWSKIFTPVLSGGAYDHAISRITKVNGAYYFYSTERNYLIKTTDFTNYQTLGSPVPDLNGRFSFSYIVSAHNHIIISTEFQGLHYLLP